MQADAEALSCNVVGFNFRGVRRSTGIAASKNHLVIDGIAQVQRLLDMGVSPENITLKGHSLGAAIATLVAYHFHQHNKRMNVFNDRSFSSLNKLVSIMVHRHLQPTYEAELTFKRRVLIGVVGLMCKLLVRMSNWNIQASSAFKAIPNEYKEYIVVSRRGEGGAATVNDNTVPYHASIHTALKRERHSKKTSVRHDREALFEVRAQIKARKMVDESYVSGGHAAELGRIKNRYDVTGATFFRTFVQTAHQDHGVTARSSTDYDEYHFPKDNQRPLLR
jgi:hypothetical protein